MEYPGAWYHVMNRGRRRKALGKIRKNFSKVNGRLDPLLFPSLFHFYFMDKLTI